MNNKTNIGVFVCECGDKIAGYLNVPELTRQAGELPGVVCAEQAGYWCMPGNLERLGQLVAEQNLERVLIAGCAPRMQEKRFQQALSGVNPMLVNVVNLRDLCALAHPDDPAGAMAKAHDQIAMGVAELAATQPGETFTPTRIAHITPRALVIGGGIAGMTAALGLGDAGIPVTLVERDSDLGGLARSHPLDRDTTALVEERIASVRARPDIEVLVNTQISDVSGPVGHYKVTLSNDRTLEVGAIIVATGADFKPLPSNLRQSPIPPGLSARTGNPQSLKYAFVLCDMTPQKQCFHSCCLTALRQATEIKRQAADSNVTIFFRELYTAGGMYNELVWEAQRLGVNFVRYPAGKVPELVDGEIVTHDELSGQQVQVACDQIIPTMLPEPHEETVHLAKLLRLPVDGAGFLADARMRLRPSDRIERGIYACGAAHYPCDAQRAMFEAYSAAARAVQHIKREQITSWAPPAVVDATRCNGCGDCLNVCPFMAITLVARPTSQQTNKRVSQPAMPPLAVVDPLVCTGCGNCVSVCPVKAAQVATTDDELIEAQIYAALGLSRQADKETRGQGDNSGHPVTLSPPHLVTPSPRHLVFACEWSGYSAAEIAGANQLAYPASTRVIRLNCTGRLQPGLLLKALEMGAAGVIVLGCAPGVCHFEQGNEHCAAVFEQANTLAHLMNLDHRLKLEWITPDDGPQFVQMVNEFVAGFGER